MSDCVTTALKAVARRCPALRARRKWWFRPAYELAQMGIFIVSLGWLVQPEHDAPKPRP